MAITQDVNSEQKIIQIAIDQHNDTGTTSVVVKHFFINNHVIRVDNLHLGVQMMHIELPYLPQQTQGVFVKVFRDQLSSISYLL